MIRRLLLLVVLGLFAIGCGGDGGEAGDGPIRVGVAGPMTGDQSRNGEELWLGARLAMEEWNEKGGILGRKIELVQKDDQAEEKEAKKVATELIYADVVAVIGHYNSGVTFPASKEYAKRKIPMLTPAASERSDRATRTQPNPGSLPGWLQPQGLS